MSNKFSLLVICFAMIMFTACASQSVSADLKSENKDFIFYYKDVAIKLGADANEVISAVGEPNNIFVSPSCAFGDKDQILYYDGFEINTYSIGGKDYILAITLTGDKAQTSTGISLGMSYDDMVAAHGSDFSEMLGSYTYQSNDSQIIFIMEDTKIEGIRYYYTAAQESL